MSWFKIEPTSIDDYKRNRGESRLVALKDQRIMHLLEKIEDLEVGQRAIRNATAQRCLEIAQKHDCRCAADEISREFGIHE